MMEIICKVLGFTEAWEDIKGLVQENYDEVDQRAEKQDLDVVKGFYEALEKGGSHFMVVAYSNDTTVGYISMLVTVNPHTGLLQATCDVVYVLPEFRGYGIGIDLISAAEKRSVELGAKYLQFSFKYGAEMENLIEALGFTRSEVIYDKVLEGGKV